MQQTYTQTYTQTGTPARERAEPELISVFSLPAAAWLVGVCGVSAGLWAALIWAVLTLAA